MIKKIFISFILFLLAAKVFAANPDDLLKPDDAFKPSVVTLSENRIKATWDIADGYYMFREGFKFESGTQGVLLGKGIIPDGIVSDDPSLGEIETYRDQIDIEIPIVRYGSGNNAIQVAIETVSQGCPDSGECYPAQEKTISLELLAALDTKKSKEAIIEELVSPKETKSDKEVVSTNVPKEVTKTKETALADELGLSSIIEDAAPLEPTEAFKLNLSAGNNQSIKADWKIVEGHYLYQGKIKFDILEPAGLTLGDLNLPKGKKEVDPFFGEITTYNNDFSVTANVDGDDNALLDKELTLKVSYQGCSKLAGICYPPQNETLKISFGPDQLASASAPQSETLTDPVAMTKKPSLLMDSTVSATSSPVSSSPTIAKSSLASQIDGLKVDDSLEPLHPDQAFIFDLTATDNVTLNARWDIIPGHYLYQHKIKFEIQEAKNGTSLGQAIIPEGKEEHDEYFGDIVTYNESFDVKIPLLGNSEGALEEVIVKTSYQGCSKLTGICYPPQNKTQTIKLEKGKITKVAAADTTSVEPQQAVSTDATNTDGNPDEMVSEQDALVNKLNDSGYGSIFLFFILGLGLTFTPCVFPMIPILSGIIAGQGGETNTRKSFMLSLSYVLAMALTYALVGVIAAVSGENLAVALQTPGVIYSFAILFVILSLSMFGFYELQMPSFIQNKLTNISNGQEGGNLISAGVMGALSALIVGPCVTAPLIALIVFIAESGDILLGGLSLFALGLGMGVPLLIIGTGAGKVLPNAGAWMDNVKSFFGIMMIALAIWMLDRVLPTEVIALLAGILLIFTAIYMGALDSLKETATGWSRFFKSTAIVILIYGITLLISAASGNASLFNPLKSFAGGGTSYSGTANIASTEKLNFKKVKSIDDLEQAIALANSNGQAVMLDFYADWCVSCKEWEGITFVDPAVINSLKDTVLLKADVTDNDDIDKAITKKFGLVGPPAIIFFDKAGVENKPYKLVGYKGPEDFLNHVEKFKNTLN